MKRPHKSRATAAVAIAAAAVEYLGEPLNQAGFIHPRQMTPELAYSNDGQ